MAVDRDPQLYDRNDSMAGHGTTGHTGMGQTGGTMDHTTGTTTAYDTRTTATTHRTRSPSWAWLLAALIALAAIFGFFFFDSDYAPTNVPATGSVERPAGDMGSGANSGNNANGARTPAAPAAPAARP